MVYLDDIPRKPALWWPYHIVLVCLKKILENLGDCAFQSEKVISDHGWP
jgi:hypothetical protein